MQIHVLNFEVILNHIKYNKTWTLEKLCLYNQTHTWASSDTWATKL